MEKNNCLRCNSRHTDNGNCTAVGGFCTAVQAAHCPLLREYLDTGLTPERCAEFARAYAEGRYIVMRDAEQEGVARLRELAEADKDKRVVVLPCKVGDKLYRVFAGEIFEHRVGSMKYFEIQGQWDIETYPFCPCVESSIGKTIFLSHKEAEKALREMKGRS